MSLLPSTYCWHISGSVDLIKVGGKSYLHLHIYQTWKQDVMVIG